MAIQTIREWVGKFLLRETISKKVLSTKGKRQISGLKQSNNR
jgi:hypothetical protein